MSMYQGGSSNGGVDWGYFDKYGDMLDKYMPDRGQGDTMASQIVTAVHKLIYKWYNDGDVFDNTHHMEGWMNNLSSYANWLRNYAEGTDAPLNTINTCRTHADYENLLKNLADLTLNDEYLARYAAEEAYGSIYNCEGIFKFNDAYEEHDEDSSYDDEDIDL